ncbi:unnamed protein product [Lymnaea stagnalis]|uniref:Transmembrane protein 60 n=1 Tax=Lymnaea stagnalis TaxID=6523 RepID=A0AAV2IP61_LYMST
MAAVHKALFTWFIILVFFIIFVLRADGKVECNWFLIFIPMWLFDGAVITYIIVNIIMHFRSAYNPNVDRNDMTKRRKYALVICTLLKLVFQFLLCLRLENFNISLYFVLIPLWTLFIAGLVDNFCVLIARHPYR